MSLFPKSAALVLTALALGSLLFLHLHVDAQAPAPSYDLLITNARIVDGSGNPWFRADVAIEDGPDKSFNGKSIGEITKQVKNDRGLIREGLAADLVIFDENTIIDQATFDKPHQFPLGISYVIVNGAPVFGNNEMTNTRPGMALCGPGYTLVQSSSFSLRSRVSRRAS